MNPLSTCQVNLDDETNQLSNSISLYGDGAKTNSDAVILQKSLLDVFRLQYDAQLPLSNYNMVLKIIVEALTYFREGKLSYFDALVGENACQMRAWKIAEMATEYMKIGKFSLKIDRTLKQIKSLHALIEKMIVLEENMAQLINQLEPIQKKWKNRINSDHQRALWGSSKKELLKGQEAWNLILKNTIKSEFINLDIDSDLQFIIHAYVLTITKDGDMNGYSSMGFPVAEVSNPKLLVQKYLCPLQNAIRLMKASKKSLATSSLEYVRTIAKEFKEETLIDRLSDNFIAFTDGKVPCGPCYYEFYCLLLKAKVSKIPMVVKIKLIDSNLPDQQPINVLSLLYRGTGLENQFSLTNPDEEDLKIPAIILEGFSKAPNLSDVKEQERILNSFKLHGLEKILLAFAAQHEQYPKATPVISIPVDGDLGLQENWNFAEEHGFSEKNPSVYLLKHAYCDIAANHF